MDLKNKIPQASASITDSNTKRSSQVVTQYTDTIPTSIDKSEKIDSSENDILGKLKECALKNKGSFSCSNVQWAVRLDSMSDSQNVSLSIKTLLNNSVHWKFVNLTISKDGKILTGNSLIIVSDIQECEISVFDFDLIIKLSTVTNTHKSYFFKFNKYSEYLEFLSCLLVWSNLKRKGLVSKWNYHNVTKFDESPKSNDIITCKFKVYGPLVLSLLANNKLKISDDKIDNPVYIGPMDSTLKEGWFSVVGHLLPNGILNLLTEDDNTLIYSVNILTLFNSEIKILHHSVLQNSNVLFLGFINELRANHNITTITPNPQFILNEDFAETNRILLSFDSRTDLENWFVSLSLFTKIEFVGNTFTGNRIKFSKEISLEIMEAQFDKTINGNINLKDSYLYCEIIMWNTPWFKSAIVKTDSEYSTFWKEFIRLSLPVSTNNNLKILIKKSSCKDTYNLNGENSDEIIGVCFVDSNLFNEDQFLQKLPILNLQNKPIGNMMINLSTFQTSVLPFKEYKTFEKILMNSKIESLISFLDPKCTTSNLEEWSTILLDVYQSLAKEDEYLETLMKYELSSNNLLLEDSTKKKGTVNSYLQYSTIFRGNSMLSKSLEKYSVRVGHEYLEKLLGNFIYKIQKEDLNCECDPKLEPNDYLANYANLLRYIEYLWERIYKTTNDIPDCMKMQWKNLRQNVELSVDINDSETPLNALSSFIFLRFLCPAILSPKLYNLSKTHYSGKISRTLVLIAKVLMTFSNRSKFQKHREPYLMPLNEDFIDKHKDEILIYFDKVTCRKMDFNEKILNMTKSFNPIQPNISKDILNEIPTMPFLIEKYPSIAKLVEVLDNFGDVNENEKEEGLRVDYQIEGFDDTNLEDDFLTSLINEENEAFNSLLSKHEFSIKDLNKQANQLMNETRRLQNVLELAETPDILVFNDEEIEWRQFIFAIIRSCFCNFDKKNGCIIKFDTELFHNDHIEISKERGDKFNQFFGDLEQFYKKAGNRISVLKNTPVSASISNTTLSSANKGSSVPPSNTNHHHKLKKSDSKYFRDNDENDTNNNGGKKRGLFKNFFKRKSTIQ